MTSLYKYRLDTEFQLLGVWYLKSQSLNDGITGTLYYEQDDIRLELNGSFGRPFSNTLNKIEYIFGFTNEGKTVILHNCLLTNEIVSIPGFTTNHYILDNFIMLEIDYEQIKQSPTSTIQMVTDKEYLQFNISKISFAFDYLNEWMNQTSISESEDLNNQIFTIQADLKHYKTDKYEIPSEDFLVSNSLKLLHNRTTFTEEHSWNIEGLKHATLALQDALSGAVSFRNLVEVFVNAPLKFNFIEFHYPLNIPYIGENEINIKGRFFYREVGNRLEKKMKINVHYPMLKKEFALILQNWFSKQSDLQFIIDSYLNDLYLGYYLETHLLNTIRNLEVYHRNFIAAQSEIKTDELLEEEKLKLLAFVEAEISESNQNRFIRNIRYQPEMTLNKRLKELFRMVPKELAEKTIKRPNRSLSNSRDSLAYKLTQTRNYYTHGDSKENYPDRLADGFEEYMVNRNLKIIIRYLIYKELGISKEKILEILAPETIN